jgi:hypothetical protein
MTDRFVTELKAGISDPRLERYRRPAGASDLDMLTNYFWNMALADALHCSMSAAEVLLRNAIHDTLRAHFGRDDWYERDELLEEGQRDDRDKVKHHIETRGRMVTPERVVSPESQDSVPTRARQVSTERYPSQILCCQQPPELGLPP